MQLHTSVKQAMNRWELDAYFDAPSIRQQEVLIVGISGGPDSVALLHLLVAGGIHDADKLVAAHVDHQLRPSSHQDATWVQAFASQLGVACETKAIDVAKLALESNISIETAGRVARYHWFKEVAERHSARFVAVGHNQTDQAETVLMRLARGAGIDGLSAMRPVSRMMADQNIWLLRPLLHIDGELLRKYCREHNLQPRFDDSNESMAYLRNRVRHKWLPLLKEENPDIVGTIYNAAETIAGDQQIIEQVVDNAWEAAVVEVTETSVAIELAQWRQLAIGVQRRLLRRAIGLVSETEIELSFNLIELARSVAWNGGAGAQVNLPAGLHLHLTPDQLLINRSATLPHALLPQISMPVQLEPNSTVKLDNGWEIAYAISNAPPDLASIKRNNETSLAYIKVNAARLSVRPARPNDKFQPLGMSSGRKQLRAFLQEQGITPPLRLNWPVVVDEEDRIIWVVGLRVAAQVAIDSETEPVGILRCRQLSDQLS